MEVGDFAVIFGLPTGRVKQYLCSYSYISGMKFESRRRAVDGRDAVIVRRVHADGTPPETKGQVFYMDADEMGNQEAPEKAAKRAMARREALGDGRGRVLLENAP
jgi:hypothetical protein